MFKKHLALGAIVVMFGSIGAGSITSHADQANSEYVFSRKMTPVKKHGYKQHEDLNTVIENARFYTHAKKSQKVIVVKRNLVQHATKSFHDNSAYVRRNHFHKGHEFIFSRIVRHGHKFRFELPNGSFITSCRSFVKLVK